MFKSPFARTLLTTLAALALTACGGGDDDTSTTAAASPAAGSTTPTATTATASTLTLSVATPAANNTTIDLATATTKGNNTRAADGFSAVPYCELFWENATAANGKKYAVQVYFRQTDRAVLHASVVESSYVVFNNDSGNPISGVTVDTATRTLTYTAKVLAGSGGELGTLDGAVGFPANASTPACGS